MPDGTPRVTTDGGRSCDTDGPEPLFDALPDPAVLADLEPEEPRVRRSNEAFARTFGYDAESVVGAPLDDVLVASSSRDAPAPIDSLPSGACEVRCETADGRERDFRFRAIPAGDPTQVYCVYTDITEQTTREETLREREQALARQNERLEEFASIVSHDLRTPLDLAGAHLELAVEGGEAEAEPHLDAVASAHYRMSDLIEDVLTWAREGDVVESTEPVSLPALLSACWADRRPDGATLDIETERTVQADRSRLRQLFDNLLDNAVTHAGPAATIRVGDLDGGVYVADDGPGIPPEERDAVFDFGHALAAESTGFGLAIVGEIVEAHGWTISVTESEAGGARFEIRF